MLNMNHERGKPELADLFDATLHAFLILAVEASLLALVIVLLGMA